MGVSLWRCLPTSALWVRRSGHSPRIIGCGPTGLATAYGGFGLTPTPDEAGNVSAEHEFQGRYRVFPPLDAPEGCSRPPVVGQRGSMGLTFDVRSFER